MDEVSESSLALDYFFKNIGYINSQITHFGNTNEKIQRSDHMKSLALELTTKGVCAFRPRYNKKVRKSYHQCAKRIFPKHTVFT